MFFLICVGDKFLSSNGYTEFADDAISFLTYYDAKNLAKTFLRFNLDIVCVGIYMWDTISKPTWLCDVLQKGI